MPKTKFGGQKAPTGSKKPPSVQEKEQKGLPKARVKDGEDGHSMLLIGLALGILLFALDQTVVGTSLPKVVADIGGFEHFAWVFTAYMLTSTSVIPLAGKFSDLYGRRSIFLLGMCIFLFGSVLCAFANEMMQLIIFRAIQGLGGGMIFPVALATVADIYPPSERGKIQGIMGAVFGFASVVGPFLGGWIVDYARIGTIESWRWVFLVNLPVGVAAITMVFIHFPRLRKAGALPIDYSGSATLILGIVPLLLITAWGGNTYDWLSLQIIGLGILSSVSFFSFVLAELRAKDPIIPPGLFKESIFTVSFIATLIMGICMFGVISFIPTYMQGVVGMTATYSGAVLLPLTLMMVVGAFTSGQLMNRFGYKAFALCGIMLVIVGYLLLSRLGVAPPVWLAIADMMVLGLGLGFTMATYLIAVQNVVSKPLIGAATSTITLVRSLGATIGVTILGSVLNRRFEQEVDKKVPAQALDQILANPYINGHKDSIPSLLLKPEITKNMPEPIVLGIKEAFANSISTLFLIAAATAVIALIVTLFLRSVPLKSKKEYLAEGKTGETPSLKIEEKDGRNEKRTDGEEKQDEDDEEKDGEDERDDGVDKEEGEEDDGGDKWKKEYDDP